MRLRVGVLLAAACLAVSAQAEWTDRILDAHRHAVPIHTEADLTPEAARRIQDDVVAALAPELGGVVGYKAGLTSPAAQQRFKVNEPILGVLLKDMILKNGARISVADGVKLLIEADLLVRVADERINTASTIEEAFAALDQVAPFLELPDMIIEPGQAVTGPVLTAVNSGARFGVMGAPLSLGKEGLRPDDLAGFTVRLERDGRPLGPASRGELLLGHPLQAVLWIAGEANRRGMRIEPGDWLSLGSLTAPVEIGAGQQYRAVYQGLGATTREVTVRITP